MEQFSLETKLPVTETETDVSLETNPAEESKESAARKRILGRFEEIGGDPVGALQKSPLLTAASERRYEA